VKNEHSKSNSRYAGNSLRALSGRRMFVSIE
jgi:hypothetical protein